MTKGVQGLKKSIIAVVTGFTVVYPGFDRNVEDELL